MMQDVEIKYLSADQLQDRESYRTGLLCEISKDQAGASISLFDNPSVRFKDAETMLFGNLSFPGADYSPGKALLDAAAELAKEAGKRWLLGPMNGSTWQDYRVPLEGDAPLFTGDSTLPSSCARMLQEAGFIQADRYHSYSASLGPYPAPLIPDGIRIRPITRATLDPDLKLLYPLCMAAFERAPYFSPMVCQEFETRYGAALPLVEGSLSFIALQDERAVAFMLAYEDMLYPDQKTVVIKTIARHPDIYIPGLVQALVGTLYHTAWELGYRNVIHAFMHETNRSIVRSKEFSGQPLRSYALFAKRLDRAG